MDERTVTNPVGEELQARLDAEVERIAATVGVPAAERFRVMMVNTWTTTMTRRGDRTFVITGDIPAMWLRDSSAQVWPFLRMTDVDEVREVLLGIVREQWRCIGLDPYANAFNESDNDAHHDVNDLDLHPGVWERKYEIDSLAFPVLLAHRLRGVDGWDDELDAALREGCGRIVALWRLEQDHFGASSYRHVRESEPWDTLGDDGRGTPVNITGMTWSGFRPSDDACQYGYNIPAQLMAVHALGLIGGFARDWGDEELGASAGRLAQEIGDGVERYGMEGERYLYEVDGLGGKLAMDDANMPSLLSLPLTAGFALDDQRYQATRAWVLSDENPFFYTGEFASGVGSPHTPEGYVWHIALAVQGLTGDEAEARRCLDVILATDGGTGLTHESFDPDDPNRFTRPWFSWSNSMACELMLHIAEGA